MEQAKRWIAWLLAAVMTVGMIPTTVISAAAEEVPAQTEEIRQDQTEPAETIFEETVPQVTETIPVETVPQVTENIPVETVPQVTETAPEETIPQVTEDAPEETVPQTTETVPEETEAAEEVYPQEGAAAQEGTCGENLTWTLDEEGTLTISGTGPMTEFRYQSETPWYSYPSKIQAIVLEEGITTIGSYAFAETKVTSVTIPEGVISIGTRAFSACEKLTEVTIPGTVTSIGEYAFSSTAITAVTLPEGLTVLGAGAFNWCQKLAVINLPAGLQEIPDSLFNYCYALTSVTIPEGVTSIGKNAFNMCRNLTTVVLPGTLVSVGDYAFNDCQKVTSMALPEGLTTVGKEAFDNCSSMAILQLPSTLTSIGEGAFSQWRALTVLNIPGSVKHLPANVFGYCQDLQAVTIGEGVETIGDGAFTVCTDLMTITIPASVTSLGEGVFAGCNNLTAIHVAEGNENYTSRDGVLFNADKTQLLQYPASKPDTEYSIPSTVQTLGEKVFYENKKLTKVTVPGSVVSIGREAFEGCFQMTTVVLEEGIQEICDEAFNSTGLTTLTLPDSLTTIGSYAFYNNDNLTTVSVGANITSIGDKAFGYNKNLTEIQVAQDNAVYASDDGVLMDKAKTKILQFPTGKTSYTVPETVTELASDQFSSCRKLTSVVLHNGITEISSWAFSQCEALTDVTLGEATTTIGQYAFQQCTSLKTITIPASVTKLDNAVFSSCSGLQEVHFLGDAPDIARDTFGLSYSENSRVTATAFYPPDNATWTEDKFQDYGGSLTWVVEGTEIVESVANGRFGTDFSWNLDVENRLTISGTGEMTKFQNAYYNIPWGNYRDVVTELVIEEGVTSLSEYAFRDMTKLTAVSMPATLKTIERNAFNGCTGLTTLTLNEGLVSIGDYAFQNCRALPAVVIPDSVTTLGDYAFASCYALADVTVGSGVYTIGKQAFAGTPWLENQKEAGEFLIIGRILLNYFGDAAEVVVPDGVAVIGGSAFYGKKNLTTVTLPDTVTEIQDSAFNDCSALTRMELPAGVTSIGASAFARCTALESINLPAGLTTIDNYAFQGCGSLDGVTLPEGLKMLGSSAFYNCTSLRAITIPDSLSEAGNYVFSGCTALSAVNLGSGLREISGSMFYGCTSLEEIYIPLNIVTIGRYAFEGCTRLADVVFEEVGGGISLFGGVEDDWWDDGPSYPDAGSALEILSRAFGTCPSLVEMNLPGHLTSLSSTTFQNSLNTEFFWVDSQAYFSDEAGCIYQRNGTILVCVPAKLSGHYVVHPNATDVYADFCGCANLTGITFSTGSGGIRGENVFAGCTSLVEVIAGAGNQKGYSNDASGALLWSNGVDTYICFIPVTKTSYTIPADVTKIYSSVFSNAKLKSIQVEAGNTVYSSQDGILYSADRKTLELYPSAREEAVYVVPADVKRLASYSFANTQNLKELWLTGDPINFGTDIFGSSAELREEGGVTGVTSLALYYPENIGAWSAYIQEMGYFFGDNIEARPYLLYTAGEDDAVTVESGKPLAIRSQQDITKLNAVYVDDKKISSDNYSIVPNGNFIRLADSYLETILLGDHTIRLTFAEGSEEIGTNDPRVSQKEFEQMLEEARQREEACVLNTEVILSEDLEISWQLELREGGSLVVPADVTLTVSAMIRMRDGGALTVREGGAIDLKQRITAYYGAVITNEGAITISQRGILQNNGTLRNHGEIQVDGTLRNNQELINHGTVLVTGSVENYGMFTNNGSLILTEEGILNTEEGSFDGNAPTIQEKPVYRVEIIAEEENLSLTGGKSVTLGAQLLPENETGTKILWTVSDPTLATLKTKGNTATLTAADVSEVNTVVLTAASADGLAEPDVLNVVIVPKARKLVIYRENGEDDQGNTVLTKLDGTYAHMLGVNAETMTLAAVAEPSDAEPAVTWSSDKPEIACFEDPAVGTVTFKGKAGKVILTAAATDGSGVKASVTYVAMEPLTLVVPEDKDLQFVDGQYCFELMAGKSKSLQILNQATGKKMDVQWSFGHYDENGIWNDTTEADSVYATIKNGKLTAKKVSEKAELTFRGLVRANGVEVGAISYRITIYPSTIYVDILRDHEVVNGKTLYLDTANTDGLELTADVHPVDAKTAVSWSSSHPKIATVEDGVVKPVPGGKPGTVTITATNLDGAKKKATVKVEVGTLTREINIIAPETLYSKGKATLTYNTGDIKPSKSGVTWSIIEGSAYASIDSKGKLTAKTVTAPQQVVVVATSKDAAKVKSDPVTITILPKTLETLNLVFDGRIVTGGIRNAEVGNTFTLDAYMFYNNGDEAELWDVKWSVKSVKSGKTTISAESGSSVVVTVGSGTTTIKASGVNSDGKTVTASLTVKAGVLTDAVVVTSSVQTLAAGKSVTLKAKVSPANATNKNLIWSILEGDEFATISSKGKLTAAKNLTSRQNIVVRVEAKDGASAPVDIPVTIVPLAQSVELFANRDHVTGLSRTWVVIPEEKLTMSAVVYPSKLLTDENGAVLADLTADQTVKWTSSNKKILTIDENTGEVTFGTKSGAVTITATAQDGSKKKATFKLNVVRPILELEIRDGVIAGGKTLKLGSLTEYVSSNATSKKLTYEITGGTGAAFASVDKSGQLKTKKVTARKEVELVAYDAYGLVYESFTVYICPGTSVIDLAAHAGESDPYVDVTGKTLELPVGEILYIRASGWPASAWNMFQWKVSSTKYGGIVMPDGSLAGGTVDAEIAVMGVTPGKTLKITATAMDGSGTKKTVEIKIVKAE